MKKPKAEKNVQDSKQEQELKVETLIAVLYLSEISVSLPKNKPYKKHSQNTDKSQELESQKTKKEIPEDSDILTSTPQKKPMPLWSWPELPLMEDKLELISANLNKVCYFLYRWGRWRIQRWTRKLWRR